MSKVKVYIKRILSLNERFAYSFLGKIRRSMVPFTNMFLGTQERKVQQRIAAQKEHLVTSLKALLPEVSGQDFIESCSDAEAAKIKEEVEKVLNHEFYILSKNVKFGDKIDWHVDFNSDFRWPKGKLYTKYNQVDIANTADVKFPRELSRAHHFLILGQAYLLTDDDRYVQEFIDQLDHWIDENPYKKSINWGCSMDIAIRAANWIMSLRMFMNSILISDAFFNKVMTSLYLHARYIYEHPEKNRVYNHNHYLSDLAGQILIALLFEALKSPEVSEWKAHGIYELFREIRVQILPTGFTYERTTNYHRLVTELIAYTIIVLQHTNNEIPIDIWYRVERMFESISYILFTDGTAPVIGDQDNGRYLAFYPHAFNYHKYLLDVGAVMYSQPRFKLPLEHSLLDVLFLFGKEGVNKYKELDTHDEALTSKAFADAGFYVMRSAESFVFINNSGLSHYNEVKSGTHTHSDLLSFVYAFGGVPFLVDPGTYVYSSNPKMRMKFRSTAMHNTLTVDDQNQNNLREGELWKIERNAIPTALKWQSNDKFDVYVGSHNGYERLADPVTHKRSFELLKEKEQVTITDHIMCKAAHEIKCYFHFDEDVEVQLLENQLFCKKEGKNINISFNLNTNYSIRINEEFISKSYNSKVKAPCAVVSFKIDKTTELTTVIKKA